MKQLFYNKARKKYCNLSQTSDDRYICYGHPATLRELAKLGWRKATRQEGTRA